MPVALQTRQLINTIKLFPTLLPPLFASCPPCKRDPAVGVGDRIKGTGLSAIPVCASSQAGTWSSKSMCGWSCSLSSRVMRLDCLWSHLKGFVPLGPLWYGGKFVVSPASAAPRGSFPSKEIPSTFQDGTALMLYLPCRNSAMKNLRVHQRVLSEPHPTITLFPPTAFPAPSFLTAPEARGKPFPLPPHSPHPEQAALGAGFSLGKGICFHPFSGICWWRQESVAVTGFEQHPPHSSFCVTAALIAIFLLPFGAEFPKVSGQMPHSSAWLCWETLPRQAGAGRKGKERKNNPV